MSVRNVPSIENYSNVTLQSEMIDLAEVDASSLLQANSDFAIDLRWQNVGYSVPIENSTEKKQILTDCAGEARPGELIAILGSSGSGKTSLLNVLAGRIRTGEVSGDVRANNRKRGAFWKHLAGYVEQFDLMYSNLTIKETLTYAALLKLPRKISKQDKLKRVDQVIASLGLTNVQDSRIGDEGKRCISGGERKKVAIGIELVTNPKLLFLDEPTSGLDAFTAQYLIENLRDLCKNENKTIIITLHQPRSNIFKMFDKVLFLSQGKVVYFGPPGEAIGYFESIGHKCPSHENPADFFLDVLAVDYRTPESTAQTMEVSATCRSEWMKREPNYMSSDVPLVSNRPKKKSGRIFWITEIFLLLKRNFVLQWRDKANLITTVVDYLFVSLLFGFVFFQVQLNQAGIQNRLGVLNIVVINYMFTIMMSIIVVFPLEKFIIIRERYSSTYRTSSFFLAKSLSIFPLLLIVVTISAVMIYWIVGLNPTAGRFFIYLLIIHILMFTSVSTGLLIGAAVPSVPVGQITASFALALIIIFDGAFAVSTSITWILRWIQYLSPLYYAFNAVAINEFNGLVFTCSPGESCTFGTTITGDQVLDNFGITFPITAACLTLAGLGLLMQVMAYLTLKYTTRPKMKLI